MNKAYLLLGSNIGDRLQHLETARSLINEHCGTIIRASSVYETAAWGKTDQAAFLNQAVEIETSLNAMKLVRRIMRTEKNMGRTRTDKYAPRIIDIDILLFNLDRFNYPFLTVPHPELHRRRFALVPLAEIAPEAVHSAFDKTVSALLNECGDILEVTKIEEA